MTDIFSNAQSAADYTRTATDLKPHIGIVLGSGLGNFANHVRGATRIPYAEIPHFPRSTVEGHSGHLVLGTIAGVPVQSFVYQFVDGKLYQITIVFDRVNFPQVTEAITTKYGNPASKKGIKYSNYVDDRFDAVATIWGNSVSEINLVEVAGNQNRSLLLFLHRDLKKLAEERLKEFPKGSEEGSEED